MVRYFFDVKGGRGMRTSFGGMVERSISKAAKAAAVAAEPVVKPSLRERWLVNPHLALRDEIYLACDGGHILVMGDVGAKSTGLPNLGRTMAFFCQHHHHCQRS